MPKKLKYKPTKEYLGLDTGFIQAATLLDLAALDAAEKNDVTNMLKVAQQWVEFSAIMKATLADAAPEEDSEDDEEGSTGKRETSPVGFGVTAKELTDHHARTNKN